MGWCDGVRKEMPPCSDWSLDKFLKGRVDYTPNNENSHGHSSFHNRPLQTEWLEATVLKCSYLMIVWLWWSHRYPIRVPSLSYIHRSGDHAYIVPVVGHSLSYNRKLEPYANSIKMNCQDSPLRNSGMLAWPLTNSVGVLLLYLVQFKPHGHSQTVGQHRVMQTLLQRLIK